MILQEKSADGVQIETGPNAPPGRPMTPARAFLGGRAHGPFRDQDETAYDMRATEAVAEAGRANMLGRRSFLGGALAAGVGAVIVARPGGAASAPTPCHAAAGTEASPAPTPPTKRPVLLAYFSRAGENYYYGGRIDLTVGNTEVLAGMISRLIGCDVHRIEPVDPYPDDYDETVARNVREQDADARPAIANPLVSIERYDTMLLGSPIWNIRAPMVMSTFAERFDFTGKTIVPFTTYAMSGLGTTMRDYTASCPGATIGEGLAVRGEEVREAGAAVEAWLRRIDLLKT
jgi:flavodoxin